MGLSYYIKKLFLGIFLLIMAGGFIIPHKTEAQEADAEAIIVKFKPSTSQQKIDKKLAKRNSRIEKKLARVSALKLRVPAKERRKLLEEYKNDPDVLYAEPDYIAKAFYITNDPSLSSQWGMYKIEAANSSGTSAWDLSGGKGVKIAILDSGIEESHTDLSGKVVARQNFSTSTSTSDRDGHGTHVAGIIAANSNNSKGVAGVAYDAQLMNVKVLDDNGSGSYSAIANGITWAADNGAKVINMSLGGPNSSQALSDAINYAWNKGVVIVAAAGNDGANVKNYPAYYDKVIAVASTDKNDSKSSFSTYGSWVDVAAPGGSIYSTYKSNSYSNLSGTSMASPHVAGLAGLIWAKGTTSNSEVRSKIESSADKISGTGTSWAYGRINALKAVGGSSTPSPTPNPTPTPTPTPSYTLGASKVEMWSTPLSNTSSYSYVYTKITVTDENQKSVSGATVSLSLTTPSGRTATGSKITSTDGTVTFRLTTREKGTFNSKVTNVIKSGYTWDKKSATRSLVVK